MTFPFNQPPLARLGADTAIGEEATTLTTLLGERGQDYTPELITPGGGTPALGNGTASGYYLRLGNLVVFQGRIDFGSTSTFGASAWEISLPAVPFNFNFLLNVRCEDAGGPEYVGNATVIDRTAQAGLGKAYMTKLIVGGNTTVVGPTNPFTWTTDDVIFVGGAYVAAG